MIPTRLESSRTVGISYAAALTLMLSSAPIDSGRFCLVVSSGRHSIDARVGIFGEKIGRVGVEPGWNQQDWFDSPSFFCMRYLYDFSSVSDMVASMVNRHEEGRVAKLAWQATKRGGSCNRLIKGEFIGMY